METETVSFMDGTKMEVNYICNSAGDVIGKFYGRRTPNEENYNF